MIVDCEVTVEEMIKKTQTNQKQTTTVDHLYLALMLE
jgi:hypothetical protein